LVVIVGAIILAFDFASSALVKRIISRDDFVITDIDHTGHEHDHVHEEGAPVEGDAQENSEPTIDNNTVTE
jgi:hypothetical protein